MDGEIRQAAATRALRPQSKLIGAVSGGWPRILSNLKSLLETGSIAVKSKS
jgi:hypothetical protein